MQPFCILCSLFLIIGFVASSPIVKREAEEDLSPLNEVYVLENDNEAAVDDDRVDRDKRKIGIIKLGVSNGLINFIFGKLDAFLDAKTKALSALDESNKAKNAVYGIDNKHSATSEFISHLISQKIHAGAASIGPAINSATTFLSSAKSGLSHAFASKFAPLSALSGGLAGGHSGGHPGDHSGEGGGGSGGILSILTSLSASSSDASGKNGNSHNDDVSSNADATAGANVGVNLGAFANVGGGGY